MILNERVLFEMSADGQAASTARVGREVPTV
jgi:hypothetical protein